MILSNILNRIVLAVFAATHVIILFLFFVITLGSLVVIRPFIGETYLCVCPSTCCCLKNSLSAIQKRLRAEGPFGHVPLHRTHTFMELALFTRFSKQNNFISLNSNVQPDRYLSPGNGAIALVSSSSSTSSSPCSSLTGPSSNEHDFRIEDSKSVVCTTKSQSHLRSAIFQQSSSLKVLFGVGWELESR